MWAAPALEIFEPVTSPTFTIINEYSGVRPLVHMDLYRLSDPDEVLALGFEEYLATDAVIAIEWPDRADELLPSPLGRLIVLVLTYRVLKSIQDI